MERHHGRKILPKYANMTEEELSREYAEMDEIFKNSVMEVIRRLSPDKARVNVTNSTIQGIKNAVRAKIAHVPSSFIDAAASHELQMYPSSSYRRGSLQIDSGEDEDSRMSYDSSEGNDEDSRSSAIQKASSSNSLPEGFKSSHKKMSKAKRLQELRNYRRQYAEHEEFKRIYCPAEQEFKDHFFDWYSEQVIEGGEIVYLFHLMVNTVQDYYRRQTFPQNVTNCVKNFLREHAVFASEYLFGMYENTDRAQLTAEMRMRECKLQVMLELKAIAMEKEQDEEKNDETAEINNILRMLRYIYIGTGASAMKDFLEEQVSDNFNHRIPKVIARIFDELCLALPADLEEYDPNPNPWLVEDTNPSARRLRARDETTKEVQAMIEENVVSDCSNGKENKKKNGKKEKEEEKSQYSNKDEPSTSAPPPATPKRRETKRDKVIPETPEEKLHIKEETFDEVVKQTPIGKLRQPQKRACRRLSELVKLSEERTRPTRAAAIASEKANKAIMSASGVAVTTTKETLFALHSPSTPRPQRSARTNLIDRFNSSMTSSKDIKKEEEPTPKRARRHETPASEEPERKRTRSSISSLNSPPISPKEIPGLGKEQLQQYKKRMAEISKCKSPQMGAQTRARVSLFEEDVIVGKPKIEQAVQKNRTGREVRSGTTVHLAHILLNVHNSTPLLAFNASKMKKDSAPRLQRLVRIAKKSQKLRLQRLRNRVRQSLAATVQTSD